MKKSPRRKIFSRYIDNQTYDNWFENKFLDKNLIAQIFKNAANDFSQEKLTLEEFQLVCVNLYFEGYKRYATKKTSKLTKETLEALEAFSDPHGKYLDSKGRFTKEKQQELIKNALKSLTTHQ